MSGPFGTMDAYLAVPRVTGLALAPDGSRLVAPVQTLAPDGRKFLTAIWLVDPDGGPARRLTRSAEGEGAPVFTSAGDVLFVSGRPDPSANPEEHRKESERRPALWRLPAEGGEAELVVERAGGIASVLAAASSGQVVVSGATLYGDADTDTFRREERRKLGVSAILHESLPVRHWDSDLGPDQNRLFALDGATLRDLTPDVGSALVEAAAVINDDGSTVLTEWHETAPGGAESVALAVIDVAAGSLRLMKEDGRDFGQPAWARDGSWLAFVDIRRETPTVCPTQTLSIMEWPSGTPRDLLPGVDLWPSSPVSSASSDAVFFTADERGHCPAFRVDIATGELTRLTRSGCYSNLCPSPDGRHLYALRNHIDSPDRVVRLDPSGADQDPIYLDSPGAIDDLPGRVEALTVTAEDGTSVDSFLVVPASPEPAPLLVWVHGGPVSSWNSWSWRWNPWLMVERGWAILLPNPGLSTGYGDGMIQRAWGKWGPVPYGDIMASTDAAVARPDIDESRTAMMGGSYGGYMANWIAGHTDRFKAIVTHASLWALDHFLGTTDHPGYWVSEWGFPDASPARYELNSPDRHWDSITTPMLVIHGDRDYRVPIGEALDLWTSLTRKQVPAKFLYFPDEGHWILKPGNSRLWYETVQAFLDHHVLGKEWQRPRLL